MPSSQLKRLKSSLREQGIVGPQKSKKQKRQASKNGSFKEGRVQRNTALQGIREQFNPFEIRAPARNKYEFVNNKTAGGSAAKSIISRPGVTKGLGEEKRRKTLLVEMQRRKKVGGIMDRRFGENDPTMTPEEKALERFVKEKQRSNRKGALFDLEDAEENNQLTHFGESLSFDRPSRADDFRESSIELSERDLQDKEEGGRPSKRRRVSRSPSDDDDDTSDASEQQQMGHFKTKKEVMTEVIAKSKLHKYERQQVKEDDDDLIAELDKGLPEVFALLRSTPKPPIQAPKPMDPQPIMNPDRAALLDGKDRLQADKEYDERLRQMAFDQRSKPTEKTMTEEEKLQLEVKKLKELEEKRIQRMKGEQSDSDEEAVVGKEYLYGEEDISQDDENQFGLGSGIAAQSMIQELGVEDEDDFVFDDLAASGSEEVLSQNDYDRNLDEKSDYDSDEDEFVQGLMSKDDCGRDRLMPTKIMDGRPLSDNPGDIAYTYECPQSHDDWLKITKNVPADNVPTIVQRIRALYHPKLNSENKAKLGNFATILVGHLSFLANQPQHPKFAILESLIRHIHSLAKTFPEEIGRSFRSHLKSIHEGRSTALNPGDLILLTAIGSIFSTSDHFHQVATPAALCMTRYLSQRIPQSLSDLATGTYLESLCLQYQRISKRYIPEVINYTLQVLLTLAPTKATHINSSFPYHAPTLPLRVKGRPKSSEPANQQLRFWDILSTENLSDGSSENIKMALVNTQLALISTMADLWAEKLSFCEVFDPVAKTLQHLLSKPCADKLAPTTNTLLTQTLQNLTTHLQTSHLARRPLTLHHHRPLAIKSSIPQFEDSFHPDRHYDPDRDRAESSRLRVELKRERKGALRELRKDASFVAREALREKKVRDGEYDRRFKRLVAEIQGEEGREKKGYEREKRGRRGKR